MTIRGFWRSSHHHRSGGRDAASWETIQSQTIACDPLCHAKLCCSLRLFQKCGCFLVWEISHSRTHRQTHTHWSRRRRFSRTLGWPKLLKFPSCYLRLLINWNRSSRTDSDVTTWKITVVMWMKFDYPHPETTFINQLKMTSEIQFIFFWMISLLWLGAFQNKFLCYCVAVLLHLFQLLYFLQRRYHKKVFWTNIEVACGKLWFPVGHPSRSCVDSCWNTRKGLFPPEVSENKFCRCFFFQYLLHHFPADNRQAEPPSKRQGQRP